MAVEAVEAISCEKKLHASFLCSFGILGLGAAVPEAFDAGVTRSIEIQRVFVCLRRQRARNQILAHAQSACQISRQEQTARTGRLDHFGGAAIK